MAHTTPQAPTDPPGDDEALARHQRNEALLELNAAILERIVLGVPLRTTLDELTLGIEALSDGMLASVVLLDADGLRLRHGSAPSLPDAYNQAIHNLEIGVGAGSCGTAAYTGEPVVVEDVMEHPYWVDFRDLAAEHGLRACWSTPIRSAEDDVVGTFALYYREPRAPTEWHLSLIESATRLARAALEHDRARRASAESAELFRTVATEVPVGIFHTDASGRSRFVNAHLCEILGRSLDELRGDGWARDVHPDDRERVGQSWWHAVETQTAWSTAHRLLRPDGSVRYVEATATPLHDSDGTLVGFVGRFTDETERREAEERRRDFEREHLIAQTLQESLLTRQLPDVPGVQAAARYVAGEDGLRVGGDWYDIFALPGGRLGIAVGDVVGRGLEAATTMGQLRSALRALAWTTSSPGRAVSKLSELAESDDRMATLVYGIVDPSTRTFHYAVAGHPPPLVAPPADAAYFLEEGRSPPLGVQSAASGEAVAELAPGSLLVLYTDGLVERRDESIEHGLARLQSLVDPAGEDLDPLCDAIIDGLAADDAGDDTALVVLRVDPLPTERLELTLPNEPKLLRAFRATMRRWLDGAGASEREAEDITLAASEAVANAIAHAHSLDDEFIELSASCEDSVVTVQVHDNGQWRVLRRERGGRGIPMMQTLMDEVQIDTDEHGTRVLLRRQLGAPRATRSLDDAPRLEHLDEGVARDAGVAVVELEREIDLSNAAELEASLQRAVTNRHHALVVDMTACHYIDSGGLAVLFAAAQRLTSRRQQLRMVLPDDSPILRAVELTGLDGVAPRCPTLDAALETLA